MNSAEINECVGWLARLLNAGQMTLRPSKPIHTTTPDTIKLSCLCRVRFGGVNGIPGNSRLSPTKNMKSEHVSSNCPIHARHNTDRTVLLCLVWRCELSRPDSQTGAFRVWSALECVRRSHCAAGRTAPQNALVRRSIYTATPDKTRPSRLPVDRRRDAGQAGSYA